MKNNEKKLHEKLWASAQQLRASSSLKLNEISEPVLGLIFLKFADVKFRKATKEIQQEKDSMLKDSGSSRVRPLSPEDYKERGILYVPEKARYDYLMSLPENENIGKVINTAMDEMEEINKDLSGVLPHNYTSLVKNVNENNEMLLTLLKNFNQIADDLDGDAFGGIYEYFLGQFALAEGQNGGEFFTAQSIVKLLVQVIEPYEGRIFDPACGSGGMFVQSANFVNKHKEYGTQVMDKITIFGQEKTGSTVNIAKMNLAIHGLSGNIMQANTYYEDPHNCIGKFDYVLANPPFNVSGVDKNGQVVIDPKKLEGDKRFPYGLPLTQKGDITNANYLWAQLFATSLNDTGRAGFVMANSATDANYSEKEIRKKMIEEDLIDVMVSVGNNMFLNVTLPCTLWFFDKDKKNTNRKGKVLFINAQDIWTPVEGERALRYWTDEQITQISEVVRKYRGEDSEQAYTDIDGFCKVCTIDEIKLQDYSLNPNMYVRPRINLSNKSSFTNDMQLLFDNFKNQALLLLVENLYRDWFINYDYPGSSKSKFINTGTQFGKIPEDWEIKELGDIIEIKRGKTITKKTTVMGSTPVIAGGKEPAYYHNTSNTNAPVITVSASGANAGYVNIFFENVWASDCSYIDTSTTPHVLYYYILLKRLQEQIYNLQKGSAQPHVYPKDIMALSIVYPKENLLIQFDEVIKEYQNNLNQRLNSVANDLIKG